MLQLQLQGSYRFTLAIGKRKNQFPRTLPCYISLVSGYRNIDNIYVITRPKISSWATNLYNRELSQSSHLHKDNVFKCYSWRPHSVGVYVSDPPAITYSHFVTVFVRQGPDERWALVAFSFNQNTRRGNNGQQTAGLD